MRNLTSGDLGILLVVIQLEVTGLKKTKVVYLLDLCKGRGEKGQYDLLCLEHLLMRGVGPILRNGQRN